MMAYELFRTTLVQSNDDWSGNNGWTVPNPLHDTVTPFDNILGSLIIITASASEYVLAVSGYETSEGAFLVTGQCDGAALSIVPETAEGAGGHRQGPQQAAEDEKGAAHRLPLT